MYIDSKKIQVQMHRRIVECPELYEVDHINHNTLDNRRANLRVATRKQNALNRNLKLPRSGVRGIQLTKYGTYRAGVIIDGKYLYFPSRKTIEEAIHDRDLATKAYYSVEFLPK